MVSPRLCAATSGERDRWETSADRTVIRWPGLDVGLAVDGLLADSPPYPACRNEYARVDDLKVTDRDMRVVSGRPDACSGRLVSPSG